MSYLAVMAAALLAAGVSMYSGFGLGTVLLPVFTVFVPVEAAVMATAFVHGANNVFKVALLGRGADREVVLRFGLPAIVAAALGALALGWLAGPPADAAGRVTPVKLVVGLLMMAFALFELLPRFRSLSFERRYLPIGGILSGFFGGLTGHQGALRSAFLAKAGLETPAFVGSNAVIGFLVDLTRIGVYLALFTAAGAGWFGPGVWPLVGSGAVAAFAGVLLGRRYLRKVTMKWVQYLVGTLLMVIGMGLALGFL